MFHLLSLTPFAEICLLKSEFQCWDVSGFLCFLQGCLAKFINEKSTARKNKQLPSNAISCKFVQSCSTPDAEIRTSKSVEVRKSLMYQKHTSLPKNTQHHFIFQSISKFLKHCALPKKQLLPQYFRWSLLTSAASFDSAPRRSSLTGRGMEDVSFRHPNPHPFGIPKVSWILLSLLYGFGCSSISGLKGCDFFFR